MTTIRKLIACMGLSLLLIVSLSTCAGTPKRPPARPTGFVQADGMRLMDGEGRPLILRSVHFDNGVFLERQDDPYRNEHNEDDMRRAAEMGFNCIRFGLNYKQFENDEKPGSWKESGFDWLDANIGWARAHDVGLILVMMIPQGGYQSNLQGDALWNVKANQDRMTALWAEIARRYADEPAVFGYALLNEPTVTNGIGQWKSLAARLLAAVRAVDRNHLVVVERILGDKSRGADSHNVDQNGEMNFFLLDDPNVLYEFHFYLPFPFTHQNADWMESEKDSLGSVWPDPGRVETPEPIGGDTAAVAESAGIPSGNTDWARFESRPMRLTDAGIKAGRIGLKGNDIGSGVVWYDDLTVTETDSTGAVSRTWSWSFEHDDKLSYWASPGRGTGTRAVGDGRNGSNCWKIAGSGAEAFLFNTRYYLAVRPDHTYVISGWMKGDKVAGGASAGFWLGFNRAGEAVPWDRAYLVREIDRYLAFGRKYDVPVFMGEFGAIRYCFEENRGGLRWVEDMLTACGENGISHSYVSWHGQQFGIHSNPEWEPVNAASANRELVDLFTRMQAR